MPRAPGQPFDGLVGWAQGRESEAVQRYRLIVLPAVLNSEVAATI